LSNLTYWFQTSYYSKPSLNMKKLSPKLLTIVVVLIIVAVGGFFGSRWIENKIKNEIESISFLSFESMDVDVFARSIQFRKVKGETKGYDGKIELLNVKGIEIIPIIRNKEFHIGKVLIEGLELEYQKKKKVQEDDSTNTKKNKFPTVSVDEIEIKNGFFDILDRNDSLLFSTEIEASLSGLTDQDILQPSSIPSRLNVMTLDSPKFFTPDGFYAINVNEVLFNNDQLKINGLKISCKEGKYELGKIVGHETDWMDASVDSISMQIANMGTILNDPEIYKMKVHNPVLKVFRDKRLPFPENNRPPLIRDILANEKLVFALDTVEIINGSITYEEFVKEEKGPGVVSFDRLNASITNLASYSFGREARPRLTARCFLYNEVEMFADISFPVNARSKTTLVKGKVLPFDLTLFNKMISYVSVIELKSGKSKMLDFEFNYTDTESSGEMKFAYNDLAISFLEKQESEPDGVFSEVKSFFVNKLVIDKNNDFSTQKFRVGKIDFKRVEKKSVFNFWWGSIQSGFKSSTGVDTSGEKIDVN